MTVVTLAVLLVLLLIFGLALLTGGLWALHERELVAERLRGLASAAEVRRAVGRHRRAYVMWLRRIGHPLVGDAVERRELAELMTAAGYPGGEALHLFAVLRMAAALLAAAIIGMWALKARLGTYELAAAPFLGFTAAFLVAKAGLRVHAGNRQGKVRREMAFVLDLMVLALESGVSLDQCLRHAAQSSAKVAPVVHRGLEALVHDIGKGTPYDVAIDRWGDRLGIPEGRELAGLFRQALLYGAELGVSLRGFSDEFANRRLNMARENVGRKAVQLTIVTVVFMLPPLLVLLGGPAFTALFSALEQ